MVKVWVQLTQKLQSLAVFAHRKLGYVSDSELGLGQFTCPLCKLFNLSFKSFCFGNLIERRDGYNQDTWRRMQGGKG